MQTEDSSSRSANAAAIVCSLTAEKTKYGGEKVKSAFPKYDVTHGQATLGRPKAVKPEWTQPIDHDYITT